MSNEEDSSNALLRAMGLPGDPGQKDATKSLGSFFTRPEVRGLYYNGQTLQLDGYRFIGCRFDNCVLKLDSDNFELVQCVIGETTRIEYSSNLVKVIKLFLGRYPWAPQFFPGFTPIRNTDGSETICDWRI